MRGHAECTLPRITGYEIPTCTCGWSGSASRTFEWHLLSVQMYRRVKLVDPMAEIMLAAWAEHTGTDTDRVHFREFARVAALALIQRTENNDV